MRLPLETLHADAREVLAILTSAGQVSLANSAGDLFRKALLLGAASNFEHRVTTILLEFAREAAPKTEVLEHFIRNQALENRYHTLFDWKTRTAAKFFSLFGDAFKVAIAARLKADDELVKSIAAFLEIGADRNRLVHEDFASFAMDKTADEIIQSYLLGIRFVEALPELLRSTI